MRVGPTLIKGKLGGGGGGAKAQLQEELCIFGHSPLTQNPSSHLWSSLIAGVEERGCWKLGRSDLVLNHFSCL